MERGASLLPFGNHGRGLAVALAAIICACGGLGRCGLSGALACTTIAVGKNASADGSTMCTHNADCLDCDFRLGRVPARDWPAGSKRPVIKFRAEFPRTVSHDRGVTWTPGNIDPELPQRDMWLSKEWRESMILGHIPQVNHTFAYLEGLYGIINEKQVAMGESTCGAIWFAGPKSDDCKECNAMFDISELSRIALERASTAREAIQIMGDLGVEHGFYGSEWDSSDPTTYEEAGEALMVTDPNEAWVFHILSDDTTASAIWAAQRIEDDHVAVVANQFIIKEISPDSPSDKFMFSENLFEVAERGGVGYERGSGMPLHFTRAFNMRPDDFPHYTYMTRRMWRVMDVFAPSKGLSPYTDSLATTYPFSVKPDELIKTQDVLDMVRDHYEGTAFDMTKGLAAGPYGDVDRYDKSPSLDGSTTLEDVKQGFFERSISIFRTSYSSVTQSRSTLPDEVGALLWVAQYKPSMSTFVPLYVNIEEVPQPMTIGSLLRFSRGASYWAFSVVGNWAERFRKFAHVDVEAQQEALEKPLFDAQAKLESKAVSLIESGDKEGATALLTDHANSSCVAAVSAYHTLFDTLVAKYHDGYQMKDPTAEKVHFNNFFYPKFWLEAVGYFHTLQDDEAGTSAAVASYSDTQQGVKHPSGEITDCPHGVADCPPPRDSGNPPGAFLPPSTWRTNLSMGLGAVFFALMGVAVGRWSATRSGYVNLNDPV